MIAAWPGMGNVALGTVDYLRRKLKTLRFAEIKIDPLSTLEAVEVDGGVSKLPKTPSSILLHQKSGSYNFSRRSPAGRQGRDRAAK